MRATRVVSVLCVIALAAAWFILLRPAMLGGPTSYIMVSGVSMEPTMYDGDLAVIMRQSAYANGDVVAFHVEDSLVIHRIIGGDADSGYVLQGDNKELPDLWRPKPAAILGRMWLQIPGAGRAIAFLQQPVNLALFVVCLMSLSFLGAGKVNRRRKRGAHMAKRSVNLGMPASMGAVVMLAALAVMGLALAAGAVFAFNQPATIEQFQERLSYEHTMAFDYAAHMQPSTLYPTGIVGPVTAPSDGEEAILGVPIYGKLAKTVDVGFNYALGSAAPADVNGEMSAVLEIRAGEEGWTKTEEILPPTPFTGSSAAGKLTVDLVEIRSLIETVEEETGYHPGTYMVSVIPTLRLTGQIGGETIDDVYSRPFGITLNSNQVIPDSELLRHESRSIGETVESGAVFSLLGLPIPVGLTRWLCAALAALFLAGAGIMAVVVLRGLSRDEMAQARMRFGAAVIPVAEAASLSSEKRVEVTSMLDLARLAQRDGGFVFRDLASNGAERYFVHDGDVEYSFERAKSEG